MPRRDSELRCDKQASYQKYKTQRAKQLAPEQTKAEARREWKLLLGLLLILLAAAPFWPWPEKKEKKPVEIVQVEPRPLLLW
jgi:hypothetical protein